MKCPREAESEALYAAFIHLDAGEAPPVDAQPADDAATEEHAVGDKMDIDAAGSAAAAMGTQPDATDAEVATDVEMEGNANNAAQDEPPTVFPGVVHNQSNVPPRRLHLLKPLMVELQAPSLQLLDRMMMMMMMSLLWASPGSRSLTKFRMCNNSRIRFLRFSIMLRPDPSMMLTSSPPRAVSIGCVEDLRCLGKPATSE